VRLNVKFAIYIRLRARTSPAAIRLISDSCRRRIGSGPGGSGEGDFGVLLIARLKAVVLRL
jgi:hypothetical protein